MIGNNSCGVHSVMSGKTDDNIDELDILTYDGVRMRVGATPPEMLAARIRDGGRVGEIYAGLARIRDRYGDLVRAQFPKIPRRVSGYNLDFLLPENGFNVARALVGSEGTCVTILEATARLVPSPPCRSLLVLGFADIYLAADAVEEVTEAGPIGLEGVDELLVRHSRKKNLNAKGLALLPEGQGWLYVEFGADTVAEAEAQASGLMERLSVARGRAVDAALPRSGRDPARLGRARVRPRRHVLRAGRGQELGRLGRRRGPARAPRRVSAPASPADGRVPLYRDRSTDTSARDVSTRASTSTSRPPPASPRIAGSSRRPRTSWWSSAARSRASTVTASRAANCCRGCTARS